MGKPFLWSELKMPALINKGITFFERTISSAGWAAKYSSTTLLIALIFCLSIYNLNPLNSRTNLHNPLQTLSPLIALPGENKRRHITFSSQCPPIESRESGPSRQNNQPEFPSCSYSTALHHRKQREQFYSHISGKARRKGVSQRQSSFGF
jgi:hypothetical protein